MKYVLCWLTLAILLSTVSPQAFIIAQEDPKLETRLPWSPGEERYIRKWLVLGPFPAQAGSSATGLSIDFLSELGGEESIQPVEGMSHRREDSSSVKWHPFTSWGDAVFLDDALEKPCEDAVAYAFATTHRREGGKALLSFGSDEGSRVWINGKMVVI